jgi:hypothetical protein
MMESNIFEGVAKKFGEEGSVNVVDGSQFGPHQL